MSVEAMPRPDSNLDHQGYEVIDAPDELLPPEYSTGIQEIHLPDHGEYHAAGQSDQQPEVIDALPEEPHTTEPEPADEDVSEDTQGDAIRTGIDVINERLETYVPQTPDEARQFMTGMQAMAAKVEATPSGYAVFGHEVDAEVAEQFKETAAKGTDFWVLSKAERNSLHQVLRTRSYQRLTARQQAEATALRTLLHVEGEATADESPTATLKRYKEHVSARINLDKTLREEKRAASTNGTGTTEPAKKQAKPHKQATADVVEPATGRHASSETATATTTGTGRHTATDTATGTAPVDPDTYGRHMATGSASQAHINTKATGRHRSGDAPEASAPSPFDTQDTVTIPIPAGDSAASAEPEPATNDTAEPAPAPAETRPGEVPEGLWNELNDDHKKAWATWNVAQRQAVLNGYAERQAIRELQTPGTLDPEQRQAFAMASADTKRRMIEAYKDARGLRYYAEAPAEVWAELSDADKKRWDSGEWNGHQKQKIVDHARAEHKARGNHLPVPEGVGEATWQRMSLSEKQDFVHNHVKVAYDVLPEGLRTDVAEASWQRASAKVQRQIIEAYNAKQREASVAEPAVEPVTDVTPHGLRARFARGAARFKQWRENRKAAPRSQELRNRRRALVAAGVTVLATTGLIAANADDPAPKAPVAAEQPATPNANNTQQGLLDDGSITIPQQTGNTQPGLIDDGSATAQSAPAPQNGESLVDDGSSAAPQAPTEQPAPAPNAAAAPEAPSFDTSAATLWEALHEAGVADTDILDRLNTAAGAAKASGTIAGYEWRGSGTDRYLEVQLQNGTTTTDTATILNAIGSYITR